MSLTQNVDFTVVSNDRPPHVMWLLPGQIQYAKHGLVFLLKCNHCKCDITQGISSFQYFLEQDRSLANNKPGTLASWPPDTDLGPPGGPTKLSFNGRASKGTRTCANKTKQDPNYSS